MTLSASSGEHRSYRVDRLQGAAVTAQSFAPRYLVELTSEGPLPVNPSAARPREDVRSSPLGGIVRSQRRASRMGGPIHIYRCPICQKTFERKSMDGALNPHKHPRGYPCPGRMGIYVRAKF